MHHRAGVTEGEKVPSEEPAASQFRRLAAKLNYFSLDPPDIRFGTLLICTVASKPRVGDMTRLKTIARFLVGKLLLWTYFRWSLVRIHGQSISGGMLVHNGALLRFLVAQAEGRRTQQLGERDVRWGDSGR